LQISEFTYNHYEKTLSEIQNTHSFSNFLNCSDNDVILRHDVDFSLESAHKMAEIEYNLGIQSTFFILFQSEFYNPFSPSSFTLIKKILKMGHSLGLHFDESMISENNDEQLKIIQNEITTIENHYATLIKTVSVHNPSINKKSLLKLPSGIVNVYSEQFVKDRKYLSDSVQNWREGCFCKHFKKYKKMHILVHPIWWTIDGMHITEIMKSLVGGELDNHKKQVIKAIEIYLDYFKKKDIFYMDN